MIDTPECRALAREISLAAQALCTGITALRKANSAKIGLYYEAFFNLATGLERLCKIVLIVDYAIDHNGEFPTDNGLRKFGHNIRKLVCETKRIRAKHYYDGTLAQFPNDEVVTQAIIFLSEFASSARYYNLDFLQIQGKSNVRHDPIFSWYDIVGSEVLRKHYTARISENHRAMAKDIGEELETNTSVYIAVEDDSMITNVASMLVQYKKTEVVQRWAQFYILRLARYLSMLISDLENEAHRRDFRSVPYLSEFLWPFRVPDRDFKRRKTWSVF